MFLLRDEHMQAFEAVAMENFVDRAVEHLRAVLPKQTAKRSDDRLRVRIRRYLPRCRAYGFVTEQQIMCYIDTSYLLGRSFEKKPEFAWTRDVLRSRTWNADERAMYLLAGATAIAQPPPEQR